MAAHLPQSSIVPFGGCSRQLPAHNDLAFRRPSTTPASVHRDGGGLLLRPAAHELAIPRASGWSDQLPAFRPGGAAHFEASAANRRLRTRAADVSDPTSSAWRPIGRRFLEVYASRAVPRLGRSSPRRPPPGWIGPRVAGLDPQGAGGASGWLGLTCDGRPGWGSRLAGPGGWPPLWQRRAQASREQNAFCPMFPLARRQGAERSPHPAALPPRPGACRPKRELHRSGHCSFALIQPKAPPRPLVEELATGLTCLHRCVPTGPLPQRVASPNMGQDRRWAQGPQRRRDGEAVEDLFLGVPMPPNPGLASCTTKGCP